MNFAEKVYELCKQIPFGKVSTYAEIANALRSSPRAVGQALRFNPYAPHVPCHRVVKSDGTIGGFMGQIKGKEIETKLQRLQKEKVFAFEGKIRNFEHIKHTF